VINENIYLGSINMQEDSQILDEISITSSNQIVKPNKDILIITKDIKAGVVSINGILPKIRGVNIDPLTNTITVNNNSNILLLVNGNIKNQNYIKNISPDRVVRVEVIRNPTGRYLTEGFSAVINIVLKNDYNGYDFYVDNKGLYSLDKSNGEDILFLNEFETDFTYTHKKLNIYGIYINSKSNTNLISTSNTQLDSLILDKRLVDSNPNLLINRLSHKAVLGIDVFINSKHNLSIEGTYKNKPLNFNDRIELYVTNLDNSSLGDTNYYSNQNNRERVSDISSILAYRWKMSGSDKLEIDYGFNFSDNRNDYNYEENELSVSQRVYLEKYYSRFEADYSHIYNKMFTLDLGYHNTIKSNANTYYDSENNSSENKYDENRNTLYTYLNIYMSDKFTSKIGCAVEQNSINTLGLFFKYNSFQPFLSFFYKKSEKTNFRIKLRSYSDYPTNTQIEPFEIVIDRLATKIGNPSLSFTTNYKSSIGCNFLKNKLSIEPYYLYADNYISKTGQHKGNRYMYSYSNVNKYESFGIDVSFKYPIISKKLFWNFTGTFYNDRIVYKDNTNEIYDYTINSNLMYRYLKRNTILALMFKKANSKQIQTYGSYSNNNDYLAVLFRQPFLKNKFIVTMLYVLPVSIGFNYELEDTYVQNNFREYSSKDIKVTQNLFMLKLTYSINKGQDVRSIDKKKLIEEENKKGFF
jgi:hypothetical protein